MIAGLHASNVTKTSPASVVVPFYLYGALSFLAATIIILFSTNIFQNHYFNPVALAVTHILALGWGTMIIMGASHQLIPVIAGTELYNYSIARVTMYASFTGIPLLVFGFYNFNMGPSTVIGAGLINIAIIAFLVNISGTFLKSKSENVQMAFLFTATVWLLLTSLSGLLLIINFTSHLLSRDSVYYLSLHAHFGIAGWFFLYITGVGSKLIPMFLISKYSNPKLLWGIFTLVNCSLILYMAEKLYSVFIPVKFLYPVLGFLSVVLFMYFVAMAYRQRIRKKTDAPMQLSLTSVIVMLVPPLVLALIYCLPGTPGAYSLEWVYGFTIFFGWISAIIFGMTFKTLPFIVWNKVYGSKVGSGKVPNPKDLYHKGILKTMNIIFITAFAGFITGILSGNEAIIQISSGLMVMAGVMYNINVVKILTHKPVSK